VEGVDDPVLLIASLTVATAFTVIVRRRFDSCSAHGYRSECKEIVFPVLAVNPSVVSVNGR
jgi:hypothetical protein